MRILIADSDEQYLEILQSYLWDRGHEAEFATDGLECIAILPEFRPDVLVLESQLPWGSADGVLALMQGDPLLRHIPVVLVADSPAEFAAPAGVRITGRLSKPYRLADLSAELALAAGSQRREERDLTDRLSVTA